MKAVSSGWRPSSRPSPLARILHTFPWSLISTAALATRELSSTVCLPPKKPLKRLTVRSARCHRAKAAVLIRGPKVWREGFRLGLRTSDFGLRTSFGIRPSGFGFLLLAVLVGLCVAPWTGAANSPEDFFQEGLTACRVGDYARAAHAFRESVTLQPASGALLDLGNAEWRCGRAGPAILAWEQARWLDPFSASPRQNLSFARKTAQIEAPDLSWYEVVSTWLPASWWAWIAGTSLWLAVGMGMLPGVLRLRKATWHQAVAALGLMVFLLSLPAHFGVETRSGHYGASPSQS